MDVADQSFQIEFDGVGKVELGHDGDVGSIEDGGIFKRLVFAFGRGNEHQVQVLTEIEAGGADELAKRL